jgi:hypothetical protein
MICWMPDQGESSGQVNGVDVEPLAAAAARFRAFLPRPIDEDAAHRLGRGSKKNAGKRQVARVPEVTLTDRQEMVLNLVLGGSEVFIAGDFLIRSKPPAGSVVTAELASRLAMPGSRE